MNPLPAKNIMGLPIEPEYKRNFRLGTRFINWNGQILKYAKIDFGTLGKSDDGKHCRHVCYAWIKVKI